PRLHYVPIQPCRPHVLLRGTLFQKPRCYKSCQVPDHFNSLQISIGGSNSESCAARYRHQCGDTPRSARSLVPASTYQYAPSLARTALTGLPMISTSETLDPFST